MMPMYNINIYLIILCSLVLIVSILLTLLRIHRYKEFDLIDVFMVSIAFYNGVVVLFIYFAIQGNDEFVKLNDILDIESFGWLYPAYSLIALFFIWLGSFFAMRGERSKNASKNCKNIVKLPCMMRVGLFLLILAIFSYWIYVLPYGGFVKYLDFTFIVRAGLFDEVSKIDRSLSFLKQFGSFAFLSTLIFFGIFINKSEKFHKHKIVFLYLILSFVFSIYVLYSWGGRLGIIKFFISLLFGYYIFKYGRSFRITHKFILPIIIIVCFMPFFNNIWGKNLQEKEFSTFIVKEFSYPIFAFNESLKSDEYRYFADLVVMPLFMLPERIWSNVFEISTISQLNTKRIVGVEKGVRGSTTTVPIDFISFGVIQCGVFGVIFMSFISGYVIKKIDYYLINNFPSGCMEMIYASIAFSLPVQLVLYSDPKHIINRNFSMICGLFIFTICCKAKSRFI
ncbi:hypothetical protein DSECCO2_334640 [anaerobic digester metagenome]